MLSDAASVEVVDTSRQDVAEKLGAWLGTLDTLKLHAAHQAIKAFADEAPAAGGRSAKSHTLDEDVQRARAAMVHAITTNFSSRPIETDAGYAPYRQRYLEQQRHLETMVSALRGHVRQVLSRASPRLKQLAYLDAAMDQMIGGREQRLMSSVPVLLEKRFEQLRRAGDEGWQASFAQAWQEVLLSEMNVRLQPVVGLMEAFSNEVKESP